LYAGHGGVWHDWFTSITSRNEGIPKFNNELIRKFKYNDLEDAKKSFEQLDGKVAAIVMEPMWLDYPDENYLNELKDLAHKNGTLLIFDEVLTGFRLANGGGQELLGVEADMVAFGKAIGNGTPLAAITGKEEYMKKFNDIFYSTTYGGETLSIAAGIAVIDEFLHQDVVKHCWNIGQQLKDGVNKIGKEIGLEVEWKGLPVRGAITFSETNGYSKNLIHSIFLQECIKQGVLFGPGESLICYSHNVLDVKNTMLAIEKSLKKISDGISNNNLQKILEGEQMKSVMSF
jgi:glutamate-1-semialdehyde 2,1-aminomutase